VKLTWRDSIALVRILVGRDEELELYGIVTEMCTSQMKGDMRKCICSEMYRALLGFLAGDCGDGTTVTIELEV